MRTVTGPFFDELERGQTFVGRPYTLDQGRAAMHQAIVGDRFALTLDADLSRKITGRVPAHPNFVTDVAIGQSTDATQHVKANLFYRDLVLLRHPSIGDTLHTTTEVVALKENRRREDRPPSGLAALRITTFDQAGTAVLDFYRCAMLPLRSTKPTGHDDDLDSVGRGHSELDHLAAVRDWDLREWVTGGTPGLAAGDEFEVIGADVVTSAPELARLTLNVARVHHEAGVAGGQRLVYGGHTIGIAAAHLGRAIPALVTVLGWDGCDHLAPVHEGDVLTSTIEVLDVEPGVAGGNLVRARVRTRAADRDVLDWRVVLLVASPET